MYTLSVSALNEQIKSLLEGTFSRVFVEGELSRITFHNSGHIYFTLKDAESSIKAVMFRGNATKLRFELKEGLKVVLEGALSLYKPRGEYQLNAFNIEPAGRGALALAFEQLKEKLSQKGYFDPSRKKPLPKFPKRIALITSATGAALQDMLRVANHRYRLIELDLYDVLVQGERAAEQISHAITYADSQNYDLIITGRGGGSIEDLWCFNEEMVADAVFHAHTPVISAVGHEIDWVISDFVADVRAATPSAAMLLALPDTNELFQTLDSYASQMERITRQRLLAKRVALEHLKNSFVQHSIEKKVAMQREELKRLQEQFRAQFNFKLTSFKREIALLEPRFSHAIQSVMNDKKSRLASLRTNLENNNPAFKEKKGFAQLSKEGRVVSLGELSQDDEFSAMSERVKITAKVISKESY
ncbi:MAG: exodeoxyribonuclease VII large subunit [Epsilonproteobacteria bacterium]|nr:exodeoxyribonuclease VII large subunit [Campylobacterota bacterium]